MSIMKVPTKIETQGCVCCHSLMDENATVQSFTAGDRSFRLCLRITNVVNYAKRKPPVMISVERSRVRRDGFRFPFRESSSQPPRTFPVRWQMFNIKPASTQLSSTANKKRVCSIYPQAINLKQILRIRCVCAPSVFPSERSTYLYNIFCGWLILGNLVCSFVNAQQ